MKAENIWTDLAWDAPPAPLHVFNQQPLRFSVRIAAATPVKLEWNYDLFATGGPVAATVVKQTAITPIEEKTQPNGIHLSVFSIGLPTATVKQRLLLRMRGRPDAQSTWVTLPDRWIEIHPDILMELIHRSTQEAPFVVLQGSARLARFFTDAAVAVVERARDTRGTGEPAVILAEQSREDPVRLFLPGANEVWIVFSRQSSPVVVSESVGAGWRIMADSALLDSLVDNPVAQETLARLLQMADIKLHRSDSTSSP